MATMGMASNPNGMHEDLHAVDGSDDSEMEVWDETEVAAVESAIRESQRAQQEASSVTQWGNAYFRPGTAPEAERVNSPGTYNDNTPTKKALCSPPTSLSEVNFALRSNARQAQKYTKSSSRPPSGAQVAPNAQRRRGVANGIGERRSGSAASVYGSPSTKPSPQSRLSHEKPPRSSPSTPTHSEVSFRDSTAPPRTPGAASPSRASQVGTRASSSGSSPGTAAGGKAAAMRASPSRKSESSSASRDPRRSTVGTGGSPALHSPQSRPPPKPAGPIGGPQPAPQGAAPGASKQRKAASARIVRPELSIHALYSQVYTEEGAPVPQSHPQMFFQKRSRPPSRHRSPQDSLGLDVQPAPIPPRMRSAHYPSHHDRPPSRCKPPPECVHLEDTEEEEELERRSVISSGARPGSSSSQRPGSSQRAKRVATPIPMTPNPEQAVKRQEGQAVQRPPSGTPSRQGSQGEFECPPSQANEVEDISESSEDEEEGVGQWGVPSKEGRASARAGREAPPGMKKTSTSINLVPFRTSLSDDFLLLFAPASSGAPPTPPGQQQLLISNHLNAQEVSREDQFSQDCMSMGLTDIPSPTDDLFGPFVDKEMFNKTFEDLCISDDDSDDMYTHEI